MYGRIASTARVQSSILLGPASLAADDRETVVGGVSHLPSGSDNLKVAKGRVPHTERVELDTLVPNVFNLIVAALRTPELIAGRDRPLRVSELRRGGKARSTLRYGCMTVVVEGIVNAVVHDCYLDTLNSVRGCEEHWRSWWRRGGGYDA
jgi:hypothetical protein